MSQAPHHDDHGHEHFGPADAATLATREGRGRPGSRSALLALTAVLQLGIVAISGSVALLADTIHNFTDALTAIPLLIAFRLARRAPTRRYPYGYHRAEDVAGLAIVALIGVSALVAAAEAIRRLLHPQPIEAAGWVLVAGRPRFPRQRGRRAVPDPRRQAHRLGRARRRRDARAHRRSHLARVSSRPRSACCRVRARRRDRRARDHGRDRVHHVAGREGGAPSRAGRHRRDHPVPDRGRRRRRRRRRARARTRGRAGAGTGCSPT